MCLVFLGRLCEFVSRDICRSFLWILDGGGLFYIFYEVSKCLNLFFGRVIFGFGLEFGVVFVILFVEKGE